LAWALYAVGLSVIICACAIGNFEILKQFVFPALHMAGTVANEMFLWFEPPSRWIL
jgi:hypothetical protein